MQSPPSRVPPPVPSRALPPCSPPPGAPQEQPRGPHRWQGGRREQSPRRQQQPPAVTRSSIKAAADPRHCRRANQARGGGRGGAPENEGGHGQGPRWGPVAPRLGAAASRPQNQAELCRGAAGETAAPHGAGAKLGLCQRGSCSKPSACPGSEPPKHHKSSPKAPAHLLRHRLRAVPQGKGTVPGAGPRPPQSKTFRAAGWLPATVALWPPAAPVAPVAPVAPAAAPAAPFPCATKLPTITNHDPSAHPRPSPPRFNGQGRRTCSTAGVWETHFQGGFILQTPVLAAGPGLGTQDLPGPRVLPRGCQCPGGCWRCPNAEHGS